MYGDPVPVRDAARIDPAHVPPNWRSAADDAATAGVLKAAPSLWLDSEGPCDAPPLDSDQRAGTGPRRPPDQPEADGGRTALPTENPDVGRGGNCERLCAESGGWDPPVPNENPAPAALLRGTLRRLLSLMMANR